MIYQWCEHFFCFEPMSFTPFYRLEGKGKYGLCMPRLREEPNNAIVFYMLFFVFCHPPSWTVLMSLRHA